MSIQTSSVKTSQIPLSLIRRPIQPVLDHEKINTMVDTLNGESKDNTNLPPVDIMHVREKGKDYYFAFGACHRLQAYDRVSKRDEADVLVDCRVLPATRKQIRMYVGDSVDNIID